MIQRAQDGKLVSGAGTNCKQLDAIIAIDKDALQFERDKLKELQVTRRRAAVPTPPCITGPMVHRVWCLVTCLPPTRGMLCFIQPGPEPRLPSPHNPWPWPCAHLHRSPPALAKASKDPGARTQIKIVGEAEVAIAKQIKKLKKRREVYVEEFFGLDGCDS